MSAFNQYDEGVFNRSAAMRGRVGSNGSANLTNGAQPGNSNTAGGGNQVIPTSSNIDGSSQLDSPFSVNNIPDDPKAYVSSNVSSVFVGQSLLGEMTLPIVGELHSQTAGTTSGTKTIALTHAGVVAISLVTNSGATITYSGVGALPSGAGWSLSGDNIAWTNGSYTNYVAVMASGWVPSGLATFKVNYTYASVGDVTTVNNNITSILPVGRQQAVLGNAAGTTQAGGSFGGWDVTR